MYSLYKLFSKHDKKKFLQKLTEQQKQTSLHSVYMTEKYFTFFFKKNMLLKKEISH